MRYLYEELQKTDDFVKWMNNPWKGKDKLESSLRLFGSLNLIPNLLGFNVVKGNFNKGTIQRIDMIEKYLYEESEPMMLKDKGDSSDFTMISENGDTLLAISSKNHKHVQVGKLDIPALLYFWNCNKAKFKQVNFRIGICVWQTTREIYKIISNAENTNDHIIRDLRNAILIDRHQILMGFKSFKEQYGNMSWLEIIRKPIWNKIIIPRPHQQDTVRVTLEAYESKKPNFLWRHAPRTGKTFIASLLVAELRKKNPNLNALYLTTHPGTLKQMFDAIMSHTTNDMNVAWQRPRGRRPKIYKNQSFVLSSVQKLKRALKGSKEIQDLKDCKFDIVFIDEPHDGGTTDLSRKVYDIYGNNAFVVCMTGTPEKVITGFNIPNMRTYYWDEFDNQLCSNLVDDNLLVLEKNHPGLKRTLSEFPTPYVETTYNRYPIQKTLTLDIEEKIIEELSGGVYGWSPKACLQFDDNGFLDNNKVDDLIYTIFGKQDHLGRDDKKYPKEKQFMYRAIETMRKENSRSLSDAPIILMFMPRINKQSELFKCRLEKVKHIANNYDIIIVNSDTEKPDTVNTTLFNARSTCIAKGKKGVIVLTGRQISTGITIDYCDILFMLDEGNLTDTYLQTIKRCLTEAPNKKCGVVVDLYPGRVMDYTYKTIVRSGFRSISKGLKYVIRQRIISINDHFTIGNHDRMIENIECYLNNNVVSRIEVGLETIKRIVIDAPPNVSRRMALLFNHKPGKKTKKVLPDGDFKEKIPNDKSESKSKNKTEEKEKSEIVGFGISSLMESIIPILSLLTIKDPTSDSFETMMAVVNNNPTKKKILIDQVEISNGFRLTEEQIVFIIETYKQYISKDSIVGDTISQIKQQICEAHSKGNLSEVIDKFLIPQQDERQKNAEVSTPSFLRYEMLDGIPDTFWNSNGKILEPTSGKGGFLVDIYKRMNNNMKEVIPDDSERKQFILEHRIYFADINPCNIFICKLLLDPNDEFKLNYYEGNSLELYPNKLWNINRFDVIIGNPPYATDPSSQGTKPLYNLFVEKYIDLCDWNSFVIPSRYFVGGKGLHNFRLFMKQRRDIAKIKHVDDASIWFSDVDIKGGVHYYIKRTGHNGDCIYNGQNLDLRKYDIIIDPRHHPIIDHVKNLPSISQIYLNAGYYKIRTNDRRLKKQGKTICYVSSLKSNDRIMYVNQDIPNDKKHWKIITARAAFGSHSGFGFKAIIKPNEAYTDSYVGFKVKSELQSKYLLSYLETKFVNHMLSIRKISQDINDNVCKWIPLPPLDRMWTDKTIEDHFKITSEMYQ